MRPQAGQRITEQIHPLTQDLDQMSPVRALAGLFGAEQELYGKNAWGGGLTDPETVATLERLAQQIATTLAHPAGRVIFAGAGTSGRLACYSATQWSRFYGPTPGRVVGLLAGGWPAYYHAREVVEDSVAAGVADLEPYLSQPGPVVYIGITCGLSAAYVAGQLARVSKRSDATVVALGFTPVTTAVDRALPGLPAATPSMRALLLQLNEDPRATVLTPMIGAEPIAGSTRMKGGSATRIVLDCLAFPGAVQQRLDLYRRLLDHLQQTFDGALITWAGTVLNRGGALTYVAGDGAAPLALLDASECPPTFGAKPFQVQAVCSGLAERLPEFDNRDHSLAAYQQRANPKDGYLWTAEPVDDAAVNAWRETLAPTSVRSLHPFPTHLFGETAVLGPLKDMWLKWQYNAVSTLAFVAYGKVRGNRMIDLRISNQKLWHRALLLIADLADVGEAAAAHALHRALACNADAGIEDKIRRAVQEERLIARAVLIARGWDPLKAKQRIAQEPRLVALLNAL